MKPGRKISLTYSAITISVVLVGCVVFLFGAKRYTTRLYYYYLEEKARVLAMEHYGEDDLDPVKYRNAVQRRQNSIPTSKELLVPFDSVPTALADYLDSSDIAALLRGEVVNFTHAGLVGTALPYYDNSGTFASLVLSRNPYGDEIAHAVGRSLAIILLVASLLLWMVSRLWAGRMVDRIDERYQAEKLFVNNAQHEINNPLAALRGECDVALLRDRPPEEYRAALQRIGTQADRINAIMQQLLALSNARKNISKQQYLTMSQWLRVAELPPFLLTVCNDFTTSVDPDSLQIIMQNLLSNASKYGGKTLPEVIVDRPTLSVVNHGPAIPEEELRHIFEPFYRGANAEQTAGHGIGLALARSLAEHNNATLDATSDAEATVFSLTFHR